MDEHRFAKYGAATGIVFVIFLIVGFLIGFPQPLEPTHPRRSGPSTSRITRTRCERR